LPSGGNLYFKLVGVGGVSQSAPILYLNVLWV
jgi:hypothetical protein